MKPKKVTGNHTGLYLYCIRKKSTKRISKHGIDGTAQVFFIPIKELEAVVSEVNIEKFVNPILGNTVKSDMNFTKKDKKLDLQNAQDLKWIIRHAKQHEKIVELAMSGDTVIPMKFGTVFNNKKNLIVTLQKNIKKYRTTLESLERKQEWGVKVYVNEEKLKDVLKSKHQKVKDQFNKVKELPRGQDYFQELENEKSLGEICAQEIERAHNRFYQTLKKRAEASKELPPTLSNVQFQDTVRMISGKNKSIGEQKKNIASKEPMILNSTYLINDSKVKIFNNTVSKLKKQNPAFTFEPGPHIILLSNYIMRSASKKLNRDENVALVDVVDRLLEKGAVVEGDVAIRLANIDLVYISLRLMVTSISKATRLKEGDILHQREEALTPEDRRYLDSLEREIKRAEAAIPKVIEGSDAEEIEQGLARLVLTVVELLRRIMEREAVRQVKLNNLSTRETQKLGMALKAMAKKMESIRTTFGLDEKDLNLELGPLGNLM
jgi:hypothetical protein